MDDPDAISYYNRKYKDDKVKINCIPGAFYKVRAQGGAAPSDSTLIDQLNKRSFVTFGCILFHTYCFTEFLYQSRIVTVKNVGPKIY